MNLSSTFWRCIIILISFSIRRWPLVPITCYRLKTRGSLTVQPASPVLRGSNVTVHCNISECNPHDNHNQFKISLELDGKVVDPGEQRTTNCTAVFHLFNVQAPISGLTCTQKINGLWHVINLTDLKSGLPPNKSQNITCETTRSSHTIDCSWQTGQETHLPIYYNISVDRENGSQIYFRQIQDTENVTIPRKILDDNTKYRLTVNVSNHFGDSQSDPFILCVKDIVIPEVPHITQIKFENTSLAATLRWKSTDSSENLRFYIRLRTHNDFWEVRKAAELSEGLVRLDHLRPLTVYEFQMKTCNLTFGLTGTSPPWQTSLCSKWSSSLWGKSPGKGPSQKLHVWRTSDMKLTTWDRNVTVLWKPPSADDYSGEVQQYQIILVNDQKQEVSCPAALSRYTVKLPPNIKALSVSAVTSYGMTPPADIPLQQSDAVGLVLTGWAPAANGSAVLVSWSLLWPKHWSEPKEDVLNYVIEWTSVPAAGLHWKQLSKDRNKTTITGLNAGVRYNISVYVVTTRGVSAPSSRIVYSKEREPASGPVMSVLVHEAQRILVKWDELSVDQRRGFITSYTIYYHTLDSSNIHFTETVPGSGHRQMWLNCPEGAVALQMTASTSAGEGPRGNLISTRPEAPAVGLVIVIIFIFTLLIGIITNLMCWSCVRERIKQKCVSWGPSWFAENLPKMTNSNAIKLLEQDGGEPTFSSIYSDPPLSPISFISQEEREDMYPTVHAESRPGEPKAETTFLLSDTGTALFDHQLEDGYKPQAAPISLYEEEITETEEESRDIQASWDDVRSSGALGGLLRGFLPNIDVDFSPVLLTLGSNTGMVWPKAHETSAVSLNQGISLEKEGHESHVDTDSVPLQQGEIMNPGETGVYLSQNTAGVTLTSGYFPQVCQPHDDF
ncbi:interleukin-23 receptor [Sphaeramia orbicularis]|uniref:interleukin-23 receptor n=1 Tax=Sphaeramia orbicularis TaxID=375764 RepID=UPI00117E477C|nr:interleukin-12 receptor subunit beta-2-like [Sphaeramia orbicularis]XP_029988156.1 interleukin-12 receptor subunit beta-2-like [Sphaeramia orbicularis]